MNQSKRMDGDLQQNQVCKRKVEFSLGDEWRTKLTMTGDV